MCETPSVEANMCSHFEELVSRASAALHRRSEGPSREHIKSRAFLQDSRNQTIKQRKITNHQNWCWNHLNSHFNEKTVLCSSSVSKRSFLHCRNPDPDLRFAKQDMETVPEKHMFLPMFASNSQNTDPSLNKFGPHSKYCKHLVLIKCVRPQVL